MKPNPWLLPGLLLVGFGVWTGIQKKSITDVEREITLLREGILKTRAQEAAEEKSRAEIAKSTAKKIDWKSLGQKYANKQPGDMPDMQAIFRMQRILMKMTPEELIAQLDEIEALGLSEKAQDQLIGMILFKLGESQPEYVLQRYQSRLANLKSGALSINLSMVFGGWAMKDPQAATHWFDEQVAAGNFDSKSLDGKSKARFEFESMLIKQIVATDPQQAIDRMLLISPKDRANFFLQGSFMQSQFADPQTAANYAKLLRATLSADETSKVLTHYSSMLFSPNQFEKIDQLIANTNASEADKQAITAKIFQSQIYSEQNAPVTRETLETVRNWAAKYSPQTVESSTGSALAYALGRNQNFENISSLVLDYQQSSGSDEALTAFLEHQYVKGNTKYQASAKALIPKIQDPATRERIQNLPAYQTK